MSAIKQVVRWACQNWGYGVEVEKLTTRQLLASEEVVGRWFSVFGKLAGCLILRGEVSTNLVPTYVATEGLSELLRERSPEPVLS